MAALPSDLREEFDWWYMHKSLLPVPFRRVMEQLAYEIATAFDVDEERIEGVKEHFESAHEETLRRMTQAGWKVGMPDA